MSNIPNILSIAGTDPTGGAGIQADLKSIAAARGYGMCVVTALVAQNTQGVREIHVPDMGFLRAQLDAVSQDVRIDAIKIGMLGTVEIINTVAQWLDDNENILATVPVVLDPVMVATSGDRLLDRAAEKQLRAFLSRATVITPNIPELALLGDCEKPQSWEQACQVAIDVAARFDVIVIVKAGHLTGSEAGNAVATKDGIVAQYSATRIDTPNTHGTGCSLSAALATRLAAGEEVTTALGWVSRWLHHSIATSGQLQVGQGHGPVHHFSQMWALADAADTRPSQQLVNRSLSGNHNAKTVVPHIAPAGPHTQELWELTALSWQRIIELPFITQLKAGTLNASDFTFYQDQDAQYLQQYSRALAQLSTKAPDTAAQIAWAQGATECLVVESALHNEWLGTDYHSEGSSPITSAYTDFLNATIALNDYVVGAAAVLPCYWLYAEVGEELAKHNHPAHPYHAWLSMYGSKEFRQATQDAITRVEQALASAPASQRKQAQTAYLTACAHEVGFFDQAHRRG